MLRSRGQPHEPSISAPICEVSSTSTAIPRSKRAVPLTAIHDWGSCNCFVTFHSTSHALVVRGLPTPDCLGPLTYPAHSHASRTSWVKGRYSAHTSDSLGGKLYISYVHTWSTPGEGYSLSSSVVKVNGHGKLRKRVHENLRSAIWHFLYLFCRVSAIRVRHFGHCVGPKGAVPYRFCVVSSRCHTHWLRQTFLLFFPDKRRRKTGSGEIGLIIWVILHTCYGSWTGVVTDDQHGASY